MIAGTFLLDLETKLRNLSIKILFFCELQMVIGNCKNLLAFCNLPRVDSRSILEKREIFEVGVMRNEDLLNEEGLLVFCGRFENFRTQMIKKISKM